MENRIAETTLCIIIFLVIYYFSIESWGLLAIIPAGVVSIWLYDAIKKYKDE